MPDAVRGINKLWAIWADGWVDDRSNIFMMKNEIVNKDTQQFENYQRQLFKWSVVGFSIFIFVFLITLFKHLLGFDAQVASYNFDFNIYFVFPLTLLSIIILFFTGGLTVIYWKRLLNIKRKTATLFFAFSVLFYVVFTLINAMRH